MINSMEVARSGVRPSARQLLEAPYVAGHCGWSDLSGLAGSHFRFTVLRKPAERILSLYDFCRKLPPDQNTALFPIDAAKSQSFEEFCWSDDPLVRMFVDNTQTRTLALNYTVLDDQLPSDWESIAEQNLRALDGVLLCESLDRQLPDLCTLIGLPAPQPSLKRNVGKGSRTDLPTADEAAKILESRIAADQRLYELAQSLLANSLSGGTFRGGAI